MKNTKHIFSFNALEISLKILTDFFTSEGSISTSEASNDKPQNGQSKNTADNSPDEQEQPLSARVNSSEADLSSAEASHSGDLMLDPLVLLCCENSLRLFSAKSLIEVL